MRRTRITLVLAAGLSLALSACGQSHAFTPEKFQAGLEESIKAAEKGKELMKDARPKRR
jgi:uncharacterized lipoprotein YehR (DUF1307 family)